MIIPLGFGLITYVFAGTQLPRGAVSTMGVRITGTAGGLENAIAAYTAFSDNVMPLLKSSVTLAEVRLKYGPNELGPVYIQPGTAVGGRGTGDTTPQVAYLIEKRATLGGRKNRGRMYIPGVDTGEVESDGRIVTGFLGDLRTAVDDFYADLVTAELEPVILHTSSSDPTDVIRLDVDERIATQRRRLR